MNLIHQLLVGAGRRTQQVLVKSATVGARWFGQAPLTKAQTRAYLKDYVIAAHPGSSLTLPPVNDAADPTRPVFPLAKVETAPTYVWRYPANQRGATLLRCGVVRTGNAVLNTDYWSHDRFKNVFSRPNRRFHQAKTVIAPFSHYFDGDVFVGYYDYMFLVAAKLCRIKAALSESEFAEAVVSYPLVNTGYEREFLALLGFRSDQIFDSRLTEIQIEQCVLGNHDNWTHPNDSDIIGLKTQLEARLTIPRTERNRIYISRAGRRRINNEDDLIRLLVRYEFRIIEDKPRSIAEQCAIYKNAEFIMGPHGASFTNLIWCEPGTHIFELFTASYVPNYFLYLAQLLGLRYSAYSQQPVTTLDMGTIGDDISVSIDDLERCLEGLFGEPPPGQNDPENVRP